jgi:class 3 adenylate cyclase
VLLVFEAAGQLLGRITPDQPTAGHVTHLRRGPSLCLCAGISYRLQRRVKVPLGSSTTIMGEEQVERRLAAILAADIVGYSRLMEANEERTLGALK